MSSTFDQLYPQLSVPDLDPTDPSPRRFDRPHPHTNPPSSARRLPGSFEDDDDPFDSSVPGRSGLSSASLFSQNRIPPRSQVPTRLDYTKPTPSGVTSSLRRTVPVVPSQNYDSDYDLPTGPGINYDTITTHHKPSLPTTTRRISNQTTLRTPSRPQPHAPPTPPDTNHNSNHDSDPYALHLQGHKSAVRTRARDIASLDTPTRGSGYEPLTPPVTGHRHRDAGHSKSVLPRVDTIPSADQKPSSGGVSYPSLFTPPGTVTGRVSAKTGAARTSTSTTSRGLVENQHHTLTGNGKSSQSKLLTPLPTPVRAKPGNSVSVGKPRISPLASVSIPAVDLPAPPITISKPVQVSRNLQPTILPNGTPLFPYQNEDLQLLCDREAGHEYPGPCGFRNEVGMLLAYDMGLGKTIVSIALICKRPAGPGLPKATLILCPNRGLISQWISELEKFAPGLAVMNYHGILRKTATVADIEAADVVITTYQQLQSQYAGSVKTPSRPGVVNPKTALMIVRFHRMILDEAQYIRNPEVQTAAACWLVKKTHGLCLSGTPAQNGFRDLFSLYHFLGFHHGSIQNLKDFDELVTIPMKQGRKEKAIKIMWELREGFMIRRDASNSPGSPLAYVPPVTYHVIEVVLTTAERIMYEYFRTEHYFTSNWAKITRLRQAADHGFMLTQELEQDEVAAEAEDQQMQKIIDRSTKATMEDILEESLDTRNLPSQLAGVGHVLHESYCSSKLRDIIDLLLEIHRTKPGEKVIVFGHYKTMLSLIGDELREHGIQTVSYTGDDKDAQRTASLNLIRNSPSHTVLLNSIKAGGAGLNIECCNHVIFVEPWWNPYVESQAIGRAHRIGQERPVSVYRMITKDTIEPRIVETQKKKIADIDPIMAVNMKFSRPDSATMKSWL